MSTLTELVTTAEDQTLSALKQGQAAALDGLTTFAGLIPESLTAALPAPAEAVNAVFGLAETIVGAQFKLVQSVLETVATPSN